MNLTAVVVDRASGPIRDIQRTLQGAAKAGTQDTGGWARSASILGDVFHNVGVTASRSFGLVGVAAGVAGGAVVALGTQLKGFAKDAEQTKFFSEEFHVPV